MKATVIANANIALVKYWGKRDEKLFLPQNSNISVTTDCLSVKTTVEFSPDYKEDILILNGKELKKETQYFQLFLNKIRNLAKTKMRAKVFGKSNFPIAAGLASSSAIFAGLTIAANEALNLGLKEEKLSILARQGSGSACRSIYAGFVEWKKGGRKDGSDSSAEQIVDENYWPDFRIVICLTSKKEKKIKSRAGMAQTVKTSPFYEDWLKTIDDDLKKMKKGIIERNLSLVGKTAEENCLKMHALMFSTRPAIIYWNPGTVELIHKVIEWRGKGLECYFTIDAGPQVKILCQKKNLKEILKRIKKIKEVKELIITRPGPAPKIVENHLF